MYNRNIGGCDMPKIIPITDLRNTNVISEMCRANREPVFITKNGYGDMVLMSIETYESLLDISATDIAISESEAEIRAGGQLQDAKIALASLRRKHFGHI
jgi:prevent-host-death family protein